MSVARCKREVDAREFTYWCAYLGVEPFGEARQDLRIGALWCLLANVYRAKGKPRPTFKGFLRMLDGEPQQTPEEMDAVLRQIFGKKGDA